MPRVEDGRVVPRVPPPPTGSFPVVTIPPARRWAIATALVCLTACYFVWAWLATKPSPEPRRPPALATPAPRRIEPRPNTIIPNQPIRGDAPEADAVAPAPPPPRISRPKPRAQRTGLSPAPLMAPIAAPDVPAQPEALAVPAPVPIATPKPIATEAEPPNGTAAAASAAVPRAPREARIYDINVRGSLAESIVRRAIERIRPLLTQCYQRHVQPSGVTCAVGERDHRRSGSGADTEHSRPGLARSQRLPTQGHGENGHRVAGHGNCQNELAPRVLISGATTAGAREVA